MKQTYKTILGWAGIIIFVVVLAWVMDYYQERRLYQVSQVQQYAGGELANKLISNLEQSLGERLSESILFDLNLWLTYYDKDYGFEFKYPSDWEIVFKDEIPGLSSFGDSLAIIPRSLTAPFCDLGPELQSLIQNNRQYYKRDNPNFVPSNEYLESSRKYIAASSCAIQVVVEKNPERLGIKVFLGRNYLPLASNMRTAGQGMVDAIKDLVVESGSGSGVENAKTDVGFEKFWGGFDGSDLGSDISPGTRQFIINTGDYIMFVSNGVDSRLSNEELSNHLFELITSTIKTK